MVKVSDMAPQIMRLALLTTLIAGTAFSQMGMGGGGMMGQGTTPTNNTPGSGGPMMGQGTTFTMGFGMGGGMMGFFGMGSGTGMGNMMSGPAVGADGTAYMIRSSNSTTTGASQPAVLMAINPQNGNTNWSLPIDGTIMSAPVLAKDGTIFLTTSNALMGTSTTTNQTLALMIISATPTSAMVLHRVQIDATVVSAPQLTPDGQTVYVVTANMPGMTNRGSTTTFTGSSTLYAFSPGGSLKFKVQLGQFQMGMMR